MANQPAPPPRQWFRFPTFARPPPQPLITTPPPPPAATAPPPASDAAPVQKSPSKPPASPPSASLTASPSPAPTTKTVASLPTSNAVSSSPKPRVAPLSPLKSDAETEAKNIPLQEEQKTVVMVENSTADKPNNGHPGKQDVPKEWKAKEMDHRKKISSDSGDGITRVITLAGQNRGAVMEIIHTPAKPKIDTIKLGSHSSSGEEGKMKNKDKDKSQKGKLMGLPRSTAFMNSHVQGINNSLVCNSTITQHDPGVHVSFFKDHGNGNQY